MRHARGVAAVCGLLATVALAGVAAASSRPEPLATAQCAIVPAIPRIPLGAKVIAHSAAADASAVIQQALDRLAAGETLVFAPGVYRIAKPLIVQNPGVTLQGHGATLFSTDATQGGMVVRGDDVAIYGFRFEQASTGRQSAPWSGGIAVYDDEHGVVRRVRGTVIQGNTIENAAAAGIFLLKADGFTVAANTVRRSWADGIHLTGGASNGRVIANTVLQSGDDMIAVVSYAGPANVPSAAVRYQNWPAIEEGVSRNIYIAGNHVADQYWGRGISVVGGADVTIEHNNVSRCPVAAGIYLEREASYHTFGDANIVVRGNVLSDIQTQPPSYQRNGAPVQLTGHGAVELGSQQDADEMANLKFFEAFSVKGVAIVGNTIRHSRFVAIRLGVGAAGTVADVSIEGNTLSKVGSANIAETHAGIDAETLVCSRNRIDGVLVQSSCGAHSTPAASVVRTPTGSAPVTGSSLQCSAAGALARPAR